LLCELLVGDPLAWVAVWVLEVQIVLLDILLVELAGSNIHSNVDLASVTSLLNGLGDELKSLLSSLNIWCDTTLVSDVASGLSVLLLCKTLEDLVNLSTLAKGLSEGWGRARKVSSRSVFWSTRGNARVNLRRNDHELLESKTSTGMGSIFCQPATRNLSFICIPSVENVHEWDRENVRLLGTGKVGNVGVEWNLL